DQLDEAMRRTEQEAHRMADLVDDLLNLARLDQGRPLDLGPVDLAAVLRDAARDAAAVEPHRPVDVEAPDPLVVQADEARIRQVVANLVGNVRMHTAPDVAVHLRLRRDGDWAVVEVADEGPGMDHETAARAFERFYRSDTARTRATGGAGLGLAIVAAVVAAHQGHVRITATPGGGTTVQVALPLAPVSGPVADPPSGPVADPPA
ncbi:MAG TPA: HAMP domain-containing sensor histidine kinase, partial [Acidimicrobiales bacterium]|nr:HAMP domain-containing sensor histidine kinase [Acidimicrobiales bacterium]